MLYNTSILQGISLILGTLLPSTYVRGSFKLSRKLFVHRSSVLVHYTNIFYFYQFRESLTLKVIRNVYYRVK